MALITTSGRHSFKRVTGDLRTVEVAVAGGEVGLVGGWVLQASCLRLGILTSPLISLRRPFSRELPRGRSELSRDRHPRHVADDPGARRVPAVKPPLEST